ncbi:MAG: alpha/beta hydrolase [Bacteroidales bacterium]|nr:alpha/beta hydrolase [Bacteroidales bacterium]
MNILYIHGMGGGTDSRVPAILNEHIGKHVKEGPVPSIVVRTYSFDPEEGAEQILQWTKELRPVLVIGESLGCLQAMRVKGIPHILVSPALGAGYWLGYLAPLFRIPGVSSLVARRFRPREGDRQPLDFSYKVVKKYKRHFLQARANTPAMGSSDPYMAFIGTRDHYMRSGVVSIRLYRKWFGDRYRTYDGTHYIEEEYIFSMLIPAILDMISGKYC